MSEMTPPQDCHDMAALRVEIDKMDRRLVGLLSARAAYIDRAIELKQINGWPARIPARVEEVVQKVQSEATSVGLDPDLAELLWRQLIDWSIAREERVITAE
jgi:isochorismate pyruvate lyase